MPISQHHTETVARRVAAAYERMRSQRRFDDQPLPDISEVLGRATAEAMHRVAIAAGDGEELVDVESSWSYKVAFQVKVSVTLLVATAQRLWIVHHVDGQAGDPLPVPYEAVRPVGKRLAASIKAVPGPQGVTITGSRRIAEWLQTLQVQRPREPAAWLAQATAGTVMPQAPPAWHPDPSGRHHLRWWDGARWSDHVSDEGTQAVDPLG